MSENRYKQARRLWELAFYMATLTRSVTIIELSELLELKRTGSINKSLRRDVQFWLDFGTIRKFPDPQEPSVTRYKWIGDIRPLVRIGQTWCRSCRNFRDDVEFPLVKGSMLPQCGDCRRRIAKYYHQRNKPFINQRQKRYYKERTHELDRQGRRVPQRGVKRNPGPVRQEGQSATGAGTNLR